MKKMSKMYITVLALLIIICFTGCDSNENSVNEPEKTIGLDEKSELTVTSTESSPEPTKIMLGKPDFENISYDKSGSLKVSWGTVSFATGYEVDYGSAPLTTKSNSCIINGIEEGYRYSIRVRAVHEDGNHVDYSDWEEKEFEVPVTLLAPKNIKEDLDGTYLYVYWDETQGANEYEVKFGSQTGKFSSPEAVLTGLEMGESYEYSIRAVKTVEGRSYYSDWVKSSYSVPTVDLSKMDYDEASLLDYDRLLKWGEKHGMTKSVTTENWDGTMVTVVDLSCKDEKYEGFWGNLREKGAKLAASLENTLEAMDDFQKEKIKDDFSSIVKGGYTILKNHGFKNYIEEFDKETEDEGEWAFIEGILKAFKTDTDKHYIYYFTDKNRGAFYAKALFINHLLEDHEKDKYNKGNGYSYNSAGYYEKTYKTTSQDYDVYVDKFEINQMNFWLIQIDNKAHRG